MVIGDMKFASVLAAIAVRVANERALPMIGKFVPGDGNAIRPVSDIEKAIKVVLSSDHADGGKVVVINPHLGGFVDGDQIALTARRTKL